MNTESDDMIKHEAEVRASRLCDLVSDRTVKQAMDAAAIVDNSMRDAAHIQRLITNECVSKMCELIANCRSAEELARTLNILKQVSKDDDEPIAFRT